MVLDAVARRELEDLEGMLQLLDQLLAELRFERVEQPFALKGLVQLLPQLVRGQQGVFVRGRHDYVRR